jgi:hypothetical protein
MWSEMFIDGVPNIPNFNTPGISYETTVFGNQVGKDFIVGLVFITQSSVRLLNGFINEIHYTTGEFWVGGNSDIPKSGTRCRINDPVGRFPSSVVRCIKLIQKADMASHITTGLNGLLIPIIPPSQQTRGIQYAYRKS